MYYAMRQVGSCCTRFGRATANLETAKRAAARVGGYVELYGYGVVWTPNLDVAPFAPAPRRPPS